MVMALLNGEQVLIRLEVLPFLAGLQRRMAGFCVMDQKSVEQLMRIYLILLAPLMV
jgi:hypothetical protein